MRFSDKDMILPQKHPKNAESAILAQQVEAFLKSGGQIEVLSVRVGDTPTKFNNPARDDDVKKAARAKNASKRASEINRVSSTLWTKNAAQYCGIPVKQFQAMVDRGEGPPHTVTSRGRRNQFDISALDIWNRARAQ